MIARFALAEGAPCPTLVLDRTRLSGDEHELRSELAVIRRQLRGVDAAHVLKLALVAPSRHPMFDLDYRFVQCLPGGDDRFEFRGSCGHSILAAVVAEAGRTVSLVPGGRVRVRVLNNGDHVVCEPDEAGSGSFTVHFVQSPQTPLARLLLTGNATDTLAVGPRSYESSLVSMGNPYVFVDARSLGLTSQEQLFGAGDEVFARMAAIRNSAAELLGWPVDGTFPKIALVGAYHPGRLAVRAISVPSWHPTLALTGTTCLGAAASVEGSVPYRLARAAGCDQGRVEVDTPGGTTSVTSLVTADDAGKANLHWVSVGRKRAYQLGDLTLRLGGGREREESPAWLPASL